LEKIIRINERNARREREHNDNNIKKKKTRDAFCSSLLTSSYRSLLYRTFPASLHRTAFCSARVAIFLLFFLFFL